MESLHFEKMAWPYFDHTHSSLTYFHFLFLQTRLLSTQFSKITTRKTLWEAIKQEMPEAQRKLHFSVDCLEDKQCELQITDSPLGLR